MSQYKNSLDNIDLKTELDFLPLEDSNNTLRNSVELLHHKGIIKICGLDIDELARSLYFKYINVEDLNRLLQNRKSFTNLEYRSQQLLQLGLNINKKRINNHHYFIEAIRP